MDDGLPQSSANAVIQSKDGYIWLATFGGLVRFDGRSFTVFDRSNSRGMHSDRILTISEDRDGALWCITEDGVLRYQHGVFTSFDVAGGRTAVTPFTVRQDSRGTIWIIADGKPYMFSNNRFVPIPILRDSSLARRALNNSGGVWLYDGRKILRTIDDSVVVVMDLTKILSYKIQAFVEYPEHSGTYWIATDGEGVVRLSSGAIRKYTQRDGLASLFARQLFVDHGNHLWAACFNGISRLEGDSFVPLRTVNEDLEKQFNVMTQDREGDYWVGTPARGLYRLRPAIISMIGHHEGLMEEKMLSLVARKNGTFLFGTNCGGVYEWKNGKATYSPLNKHMINLCVWSLFEDSKERVWVGSRVLYRFDDINRKGVLFDSSKGFTGLDIFAMMEDSRGRIWIGCFNGLYLYNGHQFRRYSTDDGMSDNDVRALFEDRSGILWIGTTRGLNKFKNGKITHVPLVSGPGNSVHALSDYIRAIYQDADGTLWFGSYGGGLIRLKDGKFSFITKKEGLYDNIVSDIVEDEQGNFWMGCNRGIFRASKTELNAVADGTLKTVSTYSYGEPDGMNSAETNGGFQPSTIQDHNGHIYFPTVSGVAVVSTRNVQQNDLPPPVKIEKLISENTSLPVSNAITLPYDSASLEIHYAALSYADPAKNHFKYMMEGLDQTWVAAGSRRTAFYWTIPPGTRTFRVIASNNDGVWNMTGASIRVTILPPFWMTWWFRTLVVLLFVSLGPYIYYVRVAALKKEALVKEQFAEQLINSQEQERRRIAMELHDGIGQQILVVKNRAEMALKTVADPAQTEEQLREIARSTLSAMNDVHTISHDLRPVHLEQFGLTDTLTNLCDQVQESSGIQWATHVDRIDGIIPREKEIHFYRIVQEGINNIMKHSSATQASIMIRRSDEEMTASLWDNGKGFDPLGASGTAGMGLEGIQERTKNLGGTCEIKSHPGEGTTVRVIIPVRKI